MKNHRFQQWPLFVGLVALGFVFSTISSGATNPTGDPCATDLGSATTKCNPYNNPALNNSTPPTCATPTGLNGAQQCYQTNLDGTNTTESGWGSTCVSAAKKCLSSCAGQAAKIAICNKAMKEGQQANDQGSTDKQASNDSKGGGGAPTIPPMPSPSDSPSASPSPSPSPMAADTPSPCNDPTNPVQAGSAACGATPTTKAADGQNTVPNAGFANNGGNSNANANTEAPSLGDASETSNTGGPRAAAAAPVAGGEMGHGGGAGGTPMLNEKVPNKKEEEEKGGIEKNIADIFQGERGGGGAAGAGGGFAGYGGPGGPEQLSDYLPGHRKAPPRNLASLVDTKSPHPDITSMHEDIFSKITKRFQILCQLKEIRGCGD